MKRKIEVEITYRYQLEVDESSPMVQEYIDHDELIQDCANYQFSSVLPVISEGYVKVTDTEIAEIGHIYDRSGKGVIRF
jgi:hypothetical protein